MRTLTCVVAAMLISACGVATRQYYLPIDARYAETGTVCGFVPWGRVRLPVGDLLSTAIDLRPAKDQIALRLQLALPTGTSVRFPNPEIRLEIPATGQSYSAQLDRFQVSVYGRNGHAGHLEYFEADATLEGRGRNADLAGPDTQYAKKDLFISGATFRASADDTVVLKMPAIEVNGVLLEAQSIPTRLVEKSGVIACVQ